MTQPPPAQYGPPTQHHPSEPYGSQPAQYTPPPSPRRRRGLLIGGVIALLVLLLGGAAVAAIALTSGDSGGDAAYRPRDKICDLLDLAPLTTLSLGEPPVGGRTTERGTDGGDGNDPYTGCRISLVLTNKGPDDNAYNLDAEVVFYPGNAQAKAGFVNEQEHADSTGGATRSGASGVGDEGFFATDMLFVESDGVKSTSTGFHVVARHRNAVVSVGLGLVHNSDWNQHSVRDALIAIVRGILTGLAGT